MNRLRKCMALAVGLVTLAVFQCWGVASQPKTAPLTAEESEVYRDFVNEFSEMHFKFLSNRTSSLDLSSVRGSVCLENIQLENVLPSTNTHLLSPAVLGGHPIRLIGSQEESAILKERDVHLATHATTAQDSAGMTKDPGILTLSEIAFDKSHQFAVVKYLFLCGTHCNSGAILVLEKVRGEWTAKGRRPCSFIVNSNGPRP